MTKISVLRAITVISVLIGGGAILLSLALPQFVVLFWALGLVLFVTALACALHHNAMQRKHQQ